MEKKTKEERLRETIEEEIGSFLRGRVEIGDERTAQGAEHATVQSAQYNYSNMMTCKTTFAQRPQRTQSQRSETDHQSA
jgi:hypothetical protein